MLLELLYMCDIKRLEEMETIDEEKGLGVNALPCIVYIVQSM